jgi:MFS family permease
MTRNDDDDEINDPARSDGIATVEEHGQHHHHRHHQYRTQHRHQYQPVHSRGSHHQQIEEIDSNNQSILSIDEALELNEIGFYHYRLLVLCGFAWMADALELNLLSYLASCAGVEFNLSEAEKAAITSVAFAGVIVGTSICGMVSDRYGRRIGFLSATFLTSIGGLLTAFSTSYSMLLISRVIVGLGIGGGNIPFDLLAELLPHQKRGGFLVFIEYFWTFGSALVSLMAWLVLDKYGWRELALITMIPVIITSFFAMYYIPESPRWLLVMQRKEEAEEVIRDSMKCNGMIQLPSFRLKSIDTSPSSSPSHHHHHHNPHHHSPAWYRQIYQDISTIVREKVTFPLWIVWMSFGFGYYGFILYISRIYSKNNNHADQDQEAVSACSFDYSNIFYNSLSEVIGVTLCIFLLEYVGRVKIQSVAYTITGLSVFVMGFDLPSKWLLMMIGMIGRMGIMIASVRSSSLLLISLIISFIYLLSGGYLGSYSRIIFHEP